MNSAARFSWVFVLVLCIRAIHGVPIKPDLDPCRCVPDQWEGVLDTTEKEVDMREGLTGGSRSSIYVRYDYINKKFSMTDMVTKTTAMADYNRHFKYVISGDVCQAIPTAETMRKMCLPDEAEFLGKHILGTNVPVSVWTYNGAYNMSTKTIVTSSTCVPITEEIYMSRAGYVSITNSVYMDVTVGIKNSASMEIPESCEVEENRRAHRLSRMKRGTSSYQNTYI